MSDMNLEQYISESVIEHFGTSGIYLLSDPETEEPLYVGRATCIATRYKGHMSEIRGATPKTEWIRSLLTKGKFPILSILEKCEPDLLESRERHWINEMFGNGEKTVNSLGTGARKRIFFGGSQKINLATSADTVLLLNTLTLMSQPGETATSIFERLVWREFVENHADALDVAKGIFAKRGLDFDAIKNARCGE